MDILQIEAPAWHRYAACRGLDQDLFFPDRGQSTKAAKAICATCPVIDACLEYALSLDDAPLGVWGGLGTREIRAEHQRRRKRQRAA